MLTRSTTPVTGLVTSPAKPIPTPFTKPNAPSLDPSIGLLTKPKIPEATEDPRLQLMTVLQEPSIHGVAVGGFDPDAQPKLIHGVLQGLPIHGRVRLLAHRSTLPQHRLMVLLIQDHGADLARRRDSQAETAGRAHTQARGCRAAYARVAF